MQDSAVQLRWRSYGYVDVSFSCQWTSLVGEYVVGRLVPCCLVETGTYICARSIRCAPIKISIGSEIGGINTEMIIITRGIASRDYAYATLSTHPGLILKLT